MNAKVRSFFDPPLVKAYKRSTPLVLVNGLAEQAESWFANRAHWAKYHDLKVPELLVYNGVELHRHIDAGGEVTVDYLTGRLERFLDEFVQRPPYQLVGSSLGGQIILTYAARHPEKVARIVLLCPSGLYGEENLPMMEGVRRSQYDTLVQSVFHTKRFATDDLIDGIAQKFQDRQWKKGVLRTLRGTVGHSVGPLLDHIPHPCLLIWGAEDKIIADVPGSIRSADRMIKARQLVIPKCGHAPQIEKARLVNHLVVRFLRDGLKAIPPALDPRHFLKGEQRSQMAAGRR